VPTRRTNPKRSSVSAASLAAAATFIGAVLPDYAWLLKSAERDAGWIRLPSTFVQVLEGLKIENYPRLYNLDEISDEDRIRREQDELAEQAAQYRKRSRGE
jgi:hypothetical protein